MTREYRGISRHDDSTCDGVRSERDGRVAAVPHVPRLSSLAIINYSLIRRRRVVSGVYYSMVLKYDERQLKARGEWIRALCNRANNDAGYICLPETAFYICLNNRIIR